MPGDGPFARVLEMRGGSAAAEAPFVIEHREALIFMLCEAAELEHGIMCQYLYAAFSLKQRADEGLSDAELDAVTRWRQAVLHIATEEMLHLALVQNLLTAVGGPPHLVRPNLPTPARAYPAGVSLALLPFGDDALRHFMYLERPEGMDLSDADAFPVHGYARPAVTETDIVPQSQDFATIGHLYRSIEVGLDHLADKLGETTLFLGPQRAQATPAEFRWPALVPVADLASAHRAVDTILDQGEGPRGQWRNAHFGQFVDVFDEFTRLRGANAAFEPARPVFPANVRPHEGQPDVELVTDPVTARCMDVLNVANEIVLQTLSRYFAHTDETDEQLAALVTASMTLMFSAIRPLGDLITQLPVGPEHPGRTAGPSFELFYGTDYLVPHQLSAWTVLTERLHAAAGLAADICRDHTPPPVAVEVLASVQTSLDGLADRLAGLLGSSQLSEASRGQ